VANFGLGPLIPLYFPNSILLFVNLLPTLLILRFCELVFSFLGIDLAFKFLVDNGCAGTTVIKEIDYDD
jgi:hypothetical protein